MAYVVNDFARWRATPTPSAETRGAPGARARKANDDGAAREPGRREAPRWRAGERFEINIYGAHFDDYP